jgi:hypothetical protein
MRRLGHRGVARKTRKGALGHRGALRRFSEAELAAEASVAAPGRALSAPSCVSRRRRGRSRPPSRVVQRRAGAFGRRVACYSACKRALGRRVVDDLTGSRATPYRGRTATWNWSRARKQADQSRARKQADPLAKGPLVNTRGSGPLVNTRGSKPGVAPEKPRWWCTTHHLDAASRAQVVRRAPPRRGRRLHTPQAAGDPRVHAW